MASFLQQALLAGSGWDEILRDQFETPEMAALADFLVAEESAGKVIYPSLENCFNALNCTHYNKVKVMILGQDPYHGPDQAHGLCFSVLPGVKAPPSLQNIFKEITSDLELPLPGHGCLGYWAQQGVLLLNSVLTVEQGKAGSHQGKGWEGFTDRVILELNEQASGIVFLLWGSYAQKKGSFIDRQKHFVLEAVHPSPLSAHRGFLGCRHFSKTNDYLKKQGKKIVDWRLPPLAMLNSGGFLNKKN